MLAREFDSPVAAGCPFFDGRHPFGVWRRHHMKQQVARFSPHQNGKVFAVLMAISSLVMFVPFFLFFAVSAPQQARPPLFMLLIMPLIYLGAGYFMVAIGCVIYNFLFKYIGGIEFESHADNS
jgi:hypothetical protein